jgi:hypothetical protein
MGSRRFLTFVPRAENVHFDIDEYLNRIIPPSQLYLLPRPISRFLGYRKDQKPDVGNVIIAFWALIGAFCGLVLVAGVFKYSPIIREYNPPVVFASLVRHCGSKKFTWNNTLMLIICSGCCSGP